VRTPAQIIEHRHRLVNVFVVTRATNFQSEIAAKQQVIQSEHLSRGTRTDGGAEYLPLVGVSFENASAGVPYSRELVAQRQTLLERSILDAEVQRASDWKYGSRPLEAKGVCLSAIWLHEHVTHTTREIQPPPLAIDFRA